ncbi:MAG: hypothetical protein R3E83_19730 [Burkholderiaceae bacterium]
MNEKISLTPSNNGGARGDAKGFTDLHDATIVVSLGVSDMELGTQLEVALAACTNAA